MAAPLFLHLRGEDAFRRCDHDGTTLDVTTATVRLATVQEAGNEPPLAPGVFDAWLAARGGAAIVPCRLDGCRDNAVLVVERSGAIEVDRGNGLEAWPSEPSTSFTKMPVGRSGGVQFIPVAATPPPVLADTAALSLDPYGRLWLLERGAARVRLLASDDLRLLDRIPFPDGATLDDLATGASGALAIDTTAAKLFFQPYGGEWQLVPFDGRSLPAGAQPIAAAGLGERLVALIRLAAPLEWNVGEKPVHALVALIEGGRARLVAVPGLTNPLPILVFPGGDLLIGEVAGPPGTRMIFTRFTLLPGGLRTVGISGARGFDGRAFFLDADGEPVVTTAGGLRPLFSVLKAPSHQDGQVETFALDSQRYGCVWHRVFLEACLPPGTAITIDARTSDDLPPKGLRRPAQAPAEGGPSLSEDSLPLGSRTPTDLEGWMPVGTLDRRAGWADVPFPPTLPAGVDTLEGLIKNEPGRYLWLRLHFVGTKHQSPALSAVRATFPRPSLLQHLPAFWRADADTAQSMDQVLSLFESFLTELDVRIDALPRLFDPRVIPPDALDWLASFIGLTLDPRLSQETRRTLLREAVSLFQQRGTVPGLTRLCSIVTGSEVDVVEGFRQRRRTGSFLGTQVGAGAGAILGPGFQLGGDANPEALQAQDWEVMLQQKHDDLLKTRDATRSKDPSAALCPPDDPPAPLDPAPLIAFHRKFAHRFTVIVYRCRSEELATILDETIERAKPAHTLHNVCWIEAGFRLGVTTYVGVGTRLGDVETFDPVVLGQSPLGSPTLLSIPSPSRMLATFVGAARIGDSTYLQ